MANEPHIPQEKPFTPFPPSHPILPPTAPERDPARDVPEPGIRERTGTHPHESEQPPLENED